MLLGSDSWSCSSALADPRTCPVGGATCVVNDIPNLSATILSLKTKSSTCTILSFLKKLLSQKPSSYDPFVSQHPEISNNYCHTYCVTSISDRTKIYKQSYCFLILISFGLVTYLLALPWFAYAYTP